LNAELRADPVFRREALAKGYGLANVELQVSVKPESVFQSGSVGKAVYGHRP